jgi:peroxiredoxin
MKVKILIVFALCFQMTLSAQGKLKIGDNAPSINIQEYLKNKPKNANLKNKYILLEFWATWCKSCIAEVPKINGLAQKYAFREDVVIISITDEKPNKTKSTLKKVDFKSVVVSDATLTTHRNYIMDDEGSYSIPQTFLIDPNGIIRWAGTSMKLNSQLFAKFLANQPIEVEDETPFDIPSPTFTK